MRKVVLYPDVPRVRRMIVGKRVTVPNQCMSLQEMLRRFVRREPLPVEKPGVYIESDYDLEKLAKMDRVEQEEILEEMKEKTKVAEEKVKKAQKKKQEEEEAKKAPPVSVEQKDPKEGNAAQKSPPPGA